MGGKAESLLRSLTAPRKLADLDYDDLVETMRDHLTPKPLVIAECFRFYKCNQHEGESISPYVAELMRLSEHCDFGQGLNDVLRDRLVCRLLNKGIQKKLQTEEKLAFKRAFDVTVSMETAARDTVEL